MNVMEQWQAIVETGIMAFEGAFKSAEYVEAVIKDVLSHFPDYGQEYFQTQFKAEVSRTHALQISFRKWLEGFLGDVRKAPGDKVDEKYESLIEPVELRLKLTCHYGERGIYVKNTIHPDKPKKGDRGRTNYIGQSDNMLWEWGFRIAFLRTIEGLETSNFGICPAPKKKKTCGRYFPILTKVKNKVYCSNRCAANAKGAEKRAEKDGLD